MAKKLTTILTIAIVAVMVLSILPTPSQSAPVAEAQDKVVVNWFVGLGTGTDPQQIAVQEDVVARFNESQDNIELVLNIAPNYDAARDTLSTLIASGEAPDIIGPVGTTGANAYAGSWLDLQPYVESSGYDLTQFPEAAVDFYRTEEGLVGLPLATFPAFIFYNRDLFDEADLPYPPSAYGEPYIDADGNEHEWTVETMTDLAMILTVDENGEDATSPDFDKENVVQWGFFHQFADLRNELTFFGPANFYDSETGEAVIPEQWRAEANWYYDAKWNLGIVPNADQVGSELLQAGGNTFASGRVGMARTHLWFTCCLDNLESSWDIAPMPSYDGVVTSPLHADTFRVLASTENPEATFEVLSYLVGDASLDLLSVYGGMPAREGDRESFFAGLDERYPLDINWDVAKESLNYPDIPSHESWVPNFTAAFDRMGAFQNLLDTTPDLDVDAELDILQSDLQALYDEAE